MAVLDDVKTELGIVGNNQDEKLNLYIRQGKIKISNYLNSSTAIDIEATYPDALFEYVVARFHRHGNEGTKQYSQGSRSGTFEDGLPQSVIDSLPAPYAKFYNTYDIIVDTTGDS